MPKKTRPRVLHVALSLFIALVAVQYIEVRRKPVVSKRRANSFFDAFSDCNILHLPLTDRITNCGISDYMCDHLQLFCGKMSFEVRILKMYASQWILVK